MHNMFYDAKVTCRLLLHGQGYGSEKHCLYLGNLWLKLKEKLNGPHVFQVFKVGETPVSISISS